MSCSAFREGKRATADLALSFLLPCRAQASSDEASNKSLPVHPTFRSFDAACDFPSARRAGCACLSFSVFQVRPQLIL